MTDIATVRTALATQLAAKTGIRALADAPGQINPPVAVIIPSTPAVQYGRTMDGEVTLNFRVVLFVSEASDRAAQQKLDAYLSTSASTSIVNAIQADPTLGAVVEYTLPVTVTRYGLIEYAAQTYFGATFEVEIGAHL